MESNIWPTPDFKERTYKSSRFNTHLNLISASIAFHRRNYACRPVGISQYFMFKTHSLSYCLFKLQKREREEGGRAGGRERERERERDAHLSKCSRNLSALILYVYMFDLSQSHFHDSALDILATFDQSFKKTSILNLHATFSHRHEQIFRRPKNDMQLNCVFFWNWVMVDIHCA